MAAGKKNVSRLGAHIVFCDESGFMMIPPVRRTWAAVGQPPIVRHYYRRARVSVIGGLSVSPKRRRLGLYLRMHPKNISQEEVYDSLSYLLRHLRGHVIVVWDGASIHDPRSLSELLRKYSRLNLERLPAYAPQPNPIETTWHATTHPLANGRTEDIHDLGRALLKRLRQARAYQSTLRGCAPANPNCPFICTKHCVLYATVNKWFTRLSASITIYRQSSLYLPTGRGTTLLHQGHIAGPVLLRRQDQPLQPQDTQGPAL